MNIRKVQMICIGLGFSQLTWGWIFGIQVNAIIGIGFLILSIAFGLLRGEL
jgi:hypothetical protein